MKIDTYMNKKAVEHYFRSFELPLKQAMVLYEKGNEPNEVVRILTYHSS